MTFANKWGGGPTLNGKSHDLFPVFWGPFPKYFNIEESGDKGLNL